MQHDLKIWPGYFAAVLDESKTFELRFNDRNYKIGDTLRLREYKPGVKDFTGRETTRTVTYIVTSIDSPAIAPGWCILGLQAPAVMTRTHTPSVQDTIDCIRQLADNVRKESAIRQYKRIDKHGG